MQSNAVAQFEAWSREESSFRAATEQADRERQRLEGILSQLRVQQKKLSSDTRESSDLLGRFHRECGLLHQEKDRLLHQLKEERALLEQCARETDEYLLQETAAKKLFCQEMESLNSELANSLSSQEDAFFQMMMCVETVSALQACLLEMEEKQGSTGKNESFAAIAESLKNWIGVTKASENQMKELNMLKKNVEALRSCASVIVEKEYQGVRKEFVLLSY